MLVRGCVDARVLANRYTARHGAKVKNSMAGRRCDWIVQVSFTREVIFEISRAIVETHRERARARFSTFRI